MPRKTINDYVFYKFVCNDENIKCCYVGSTANFSDRKRNHLKNYNNLYRSEHNRKIYETIRANGGWENWRMVIIGEAKEISLIQSRILEQNYIDELEAKMNTIRAYTSTEQRNEQKKIYYEANKEKMKKYYKEYDKIRYENNKEQENKRAKDWRDLNKEKLIEQRKIKYENNKELMKERCKAYREANKEKIKEKNNERYRLNKL